MLPLHDTERGAEILAHAYRVFDHRRRAGRLDFEAAEMICPTCKEKLVCIETRQKIIGIYRRYKCKSCKIKPIVTMERIVPPKGMK